MFPVICLNVNGIEGFFVRHSRIRPILVGLVVVLSLSAVYVMAIRRDMTDFGVCYRAGGRFLAGEALYRAADGHLQFKYAPAGAMFYAPLSALPWEAAKALWFVIIFACLAGILRIAALWAAKRGVSPGWPAFGAVVVLLKYLGREFQLGQVNLLILFLMTLMVLEWTSGRPARAGIFWGLSLLFKPYAAIFLPYFIIKKKWPTAAAGGATLLAGLLIPAVRFGWEGNRLLLGDWARSLGASTPGLLRVGDNASIYAFIAKTFGLSSDTPAMIAGGFVAAIFAAFVFWMILQGRKTAVPESEFLESAVLMMLIPVLSPLGWNYNYLYGLPAIFMLLTVFNRLILWEKGLLIADFILIGGTIREVLGKTAFRFYTGRSFVVPSFLFLFLILFLVRRRRLA
jgi:hypothetical protein